MDIQKTIAELDNGYRDTIGNIKTVYGESDQLTQLAVPTFVGRIVSSYQALNALSKDETKTLATLELLQAYIKRQLETIQQAKAEGQWDELRNAQDAFYDAQGDEEDDWHSIPAATPSQAPDPELQVI